MRGKLDTIAHRFNSKMRIIGGQEFFGLILPAPILSTSGQLNPQRFLRTTLNPPVTFGDVIVADTQTFIVTLHGEGYYNSPIYQHFKLYPVDAVEVLKITTVEEDPVTGEEIKVRNGDGGNAYLSFITQNSKSENLVINQDIKTAVCNRVVNKGDILGNYVVTKSDLVRGVCMVELKEVTDA